MPASFRNTQAIPMDTVPVLPFADFRNALLAGCGSGQRVTSFFAVPTAAGHTRLMLLLADDKQHLLIPFLTEVDRRYVALTPDLPQIHLFERELFEQSAILPENHPWLKPVRQGHTETQPYPFFSMSGEAVHEVAVGPVHAGVIEPGHFRFQAQGEVVHHLEIQLGYQHRGIEAALLAGPHKRTLGQMETLAGDTSVAHATAYCQIMESLGGIHAPPRAAALRALALELERLANHVGDLGAIANDVGFLPTASFCGRLRGDFLNFTALLCGSRFGRGLLRPGGVAFDLDDTLSTQLTQRLASAQHDLSTALRLFFDSRSVVARLEETGALGAKTCVDLGIVGLAARASGLARDVRHDHPSGWFEHAAPPLSLWPSGDVFARAKVRQLEIDASLDFIEALLSHLPAGEVSEDCPAPRPNMCAASLAEGWRGEVAHVALTDERGTFLRYKVTDPSFHNWPALAMALRGQQISDFPLCNKSFNLSYCGFDL